MLTPLAESTVRQLRAMFDAIDTDGDGLVLAQDLAQAFRLVKRDTDAATTARLVSEASGGGDTMNLALFIAVMEPRLALFATKPALARAVGVFEDKGVVPVARLKQYLDGGAEAEQAMAKFGRQDELTGEEVFNTKRFVESVGVDE